VWSGLRSREPLEFLLAQKTELSRLTTVCSGNTRTLCSQDFLWQSEQDYLVYLQLNDFAEMKSCELPIEIKNSSK
jgi:hypothetical protein